MIQSRNTNSYEAKIRPAAAAGRRAGSSKADSKSRMFSSVRVSVASAFTITLAISVEPPTAVSRVFKSVNTLPPLGKRSRMLYSDSRPVAANPKAAVTATTTIMYGAGRRVTLLPSVPANLSTPGKAVAMGRGGFRVPRASRRRSMIVLPAGSSVNMTIKANPTPKPPTMPKSPIISIGENRPASRLTIVVTAASNKGNVTFRRPTLTAGTTDPPARRSSR